MNCRLSYRRPERGIALVITLVMLAIVTVMAIVFLAVSRRERSAVKMAEELTTAHALAEAALERAKAEAVARMMLEGSKLHYDLFNSTNFVKPAYTPQPANSPADPSNVSYYDNNGDLLAGTDYLRMLANLQYDARVPVFVETNDNGQTDFRFYLDFNRNRLFETNGLVPRIDVTGTVVGTNVLVGDPEWLGVLERPDEPHSETNRFIGRIAYLVLPAGKTLDINYIHNQADPASDDLIDTIIPSTRNGFSRNQGVGSWEINLAAFLREINTNVWTPATYRYRLGANGLSAGAAFDDARGILAFRYGGRRSNLAWAVDALGLGNPFNPNNQQNFGADWIDNYSDDKYIVRNGDIFLPLNQRQENDLPTRPWPGSLSTNAFTDIQQLFSLEMQRYAPGISNRLQRAMRLRSTDDRYSFYRLAAQLGADSTPALKGKLHLNYDNGVGEVTNTIRRWTNAVRFFTNAADLMLKASIDRIETNVVNGVTSVRYKIADTYVRTNFSITNIQVYAPPTPAAPYATGNEYTPTIHRILQVALNIYDNTTNTTRVAPYFPTVLRPIYTRTPTNLIISGFMEITNSRSLLEVWQDPAEFYRTNTAVGGPYTNYNFYGQHTLVGVKKGHPNFNELALQSYVEVSRKLEVAKNAPGGTVNDTNQMFLVSMMNRWGMETWNSYTSDYPRNVRIAGEVVSRIAIRDLSTNTFPLVYATQIRAARSTNINNWRGGAFDILLDQSFPLLRDVAYSAGTGFRATNQVLFSNIEPSPRFQLVTTNDVRFWMFEQTSGRIIDAVSFDNLTTVLDLSTNLYSLPSPVNQQVTGGRTVFNENMFWDATPISPGSLITVGITNQIAVSSGDIEVDDDTWRAYRYNSPDKRAGIAGFRSFIGAGLRPTDPVVQPSTDITHQAPFVPTRRMHQLITWSANDPLVHHMPEDLTRRPNSDKPTNLRVEEPLPVWNIGRINDGIYRPWGIPDANDPTTYMIALKDPGVRKSDDWEFPIAEAVTNSYHFPNIGALGRVHRGTPWQTIYLKPILQFGVTNEIRLDLDPNFWKAWAGSVGGYPMHDWRLLDVFTTAPNENAARGLLSVNQTNRAAWSAVLSGVMVATNAISNPVLGPHQGVNPTNAFKAIAIEPGSPQIARIVESINLARENQWEIVTNRNRAANPRQEWLIVPKTNSNSMKQLTVFQSVGDVLSAPHLTVQSPFLNNHLRQVRHVWTDRTVEYVPQQIMSLLQRDEPRFVVYAFGQSLKPAPRSLTTSADFYNLVTNYQITGEVITKTTFRVEGEVINPANPLRAVVESYNILPPPE